MVVAESFVAARRPLRVALQPQPADRRAPARGAARPSRDPRASGVVANPHWLPAELLTHGTLRQQIDHWLGSLAPELADGRPPRSMPPRVPIRCGCSGAPPRSPSSQCRPSDRWKIRCFGRLRVYRDDGSQVNWEVSGGATRKAKTLFAYLLQKGGRGATTDELADLLWPEAESLETARNRLYHTVKCLREALAGRPGRGAGMRELSAARRLALRTGAAAERSWLDISTFEQLCRQSQSHIKSARDDEALICLQAADRLYTGDLFEDIPPNMPTTASATGAGRSATGCATCSSRCSATPRASTASARIIRPPWRIARRRSPSIRYARAPMKRPCTCFARRAPRGDRPAIQALSGSLRHFDDRPQSAALRQTYRRLADRNCRVIRIIC